MAFFNKQEKLNNHTVGAMGVCAVVFLQEKIKFWEIFHKQILDFPVQIIIVA